jgi:hypothetical protein
MVAVEGGMSDTETRITDARSLKRLAELEASIKAGRRIFYKVGCALREIRDTHLYKMRDGGKYTTFEAYCLAVWGLQRAHSYRQIASADVVDALSPMGGDTHELTERLVRPLTKLKTADEQASCFEEAQKQASHEGRPITSRHVDGVVREYRDQQEPTTVYSGLIKPSDNWNFSAIFYGRIDGEDGHGYIPGEVYANALWYYTKPGDVVVDPMAGSGQIFRVYDDRARWMRPKVWELDIHAFDLTPRGPYADRIGQHDLRHGFPLDRADYVFLDVPYFGMVKGQYSDSPDDMANMDLETWRTSIVAIAMACAGAQEVSKLCTVVSPNFRDFTTGEAILAPRLIQRAFEDAGYVLHDMAYASRRIQQTQTPAMAMMNNYAREQRVMLTDISEVLTFRKVSPCCE